ncbi:MAG: porin family protein [Cyclobacteriaceae bacterium]
MHFNKKLSCLLIVFFLLAGLQTSNAQQIGLRAGLNVANIGGQEAGFLTRLAYHAGLQYDQEVTDRIHFTTGLSYSLQGAVVDVNREVRLNLHYLNLPLLARLYFLDEISFDFGTQLSYLLLANQTFQGDSFDFPGYEPRKFDLALVLGFTYGLNENIGFGIHYNLGLLSLSGTSITYEQRPTNRVLQISMCYYF